MVTREADAAGKAVVDLLLLVMVAVAMLLSRLTFGIKPRDIRWLILTKGIRGRVNP